MIEAVAREVVAAARTARVTRLPRVGRRSRLTTSGGERWQERTGRNRRHLLVGLLRQSVFGRLAGYTGSAASASQMGRFETKVAEPAREPRRLAGLPGQWIDKVHQRRPPKTIVLDMDSSESPTYGAQEGSAYNGHFGCTCYHPLFVFNQLGDLERCALRSATCTVPTIGGRCWSRWSSATGAP